MALALTPHSVRDYVLQRERDLPATEQTHFKLRLLSAAEHSSIQGEWVSLSTKFDALVRACDLALVGWVNLRSPTGAEVPFPSGKEPGMSRPVDHLHQDDVLEIGSKAIANSTLGGDDLGKSKPGSASPSAT